MMWTSNYKTRNILGKNISSDVGKYFNGGLIRYATKKRILEVFKKVLLNHSIDHQTT